jgi:NADH:ubiquinone oxidoreductase subunit 5 (subunit L)/multisubunit Na+/H+ antiporter MnhA subunit
VSALLLAAVALPALAATVIALGHARDEERSSRVGAAAAGVACSLAAALIVAVTAGGPVSLVAGRSGAGIGLVADRLSGVMLLLVLAVSAVVQGFTGRYLCGDPRQRRLIVVVGLTTSAVATMVCAATLSVLVAAWTATGAGLLALLAQRADLAPARLGVRRAAMAFAVGDLALLLAGVVAWTTVGDLDLREVGVEAARLSAEHVTLLGVRIDAGELMACLLVVAAMGRSALVPLQRWLPATLAAPTPVSAFLHAGLVNAGGFLLVRLGPVFGLSSAATYLAFIAGAATALYGTALMLAKPDVKGALAHSTMGQMGFMVLACSLGAFAAAIFHLIAHGMYKATLFLGADSVIHNGKRRAVVARPAPSGTGWRTSARLLVAAGVPAVALAAALASFASRAVDQPGAIVLVAFAWATAARAAFSWLGATPGRATAGLAALALACLAYAGLVAGADAFLTPALGHPTHVVTPWLAIVPAAAMAVALLAPGAGARRWRAALYAWALDAGHVTAHRTAPQRARALTPQHLRLRPRPHRSLI